MRATICCILSITCLGAAEELLTNGAFGDGAPAPWEAGIGSCQLVADGAPSAPAALRCSPADSGELRVAQKLPGDLSGRTLALSGKVFVRHNQNQPAMVFVFTQNAGWQKGDWKPVHMVTQGDSWQHFELTYQIPKDAPHVTVGIYSKGGGEIQLDDWSATLR